MAYQQQRLLADFDALLSQLGSWPNDSIIYDLTAFLDCGKQSAIELSDCLVARIMNPAIGQEYKFPLFCLLDSVVCGVPEPYASLFSHVIVDMFKYVFENSNHEDRGRFDDLLKRWQSQMLFHVPLLQAMRHIVQTCPPPGVLPLPPLPGGPPPPHQLMMEPPPYSMPNMQNMLRGFVAQGEVFIDKTAAGILLSRIKSEAQRNVPVVAPQVDRNVNEAMKLISSKLGPLVDEAMSCFDVPLPKLLRTPLPLEELGQYKRLLSGNISTPTVINTSNNSHRTANYTGESLDIKPSIDEPTTKKQKLSTPPFRVDELGRKADRPVKALYGLGFKSEDGLRFKSQADLDKYLDILAIRNKDKLKRSDGGLLCRKWYCRIRDWITDFNTLNKENVRNPRDFGELQSYGEEMVVPADENFSRCPVSKELFETIWDEEIGDYMFRNAVKVLIAPQCEEYFALGQPTTSSFFRYIIVHKHLVLDQWITDMKIESVKECVFRLRAAGASRDLVSAIVDASEEDEDEVDVFVMIGKDVVLIDTTISSGVMECKENDLGLVEVEAKQDSI